MFKRLQNNIIYLPCKKHFFNKQHHAEIKRIWYQKEKQTLQMKDLLNKKHYCTKMQQNPYNTNEKQCLPPSSSGHSPYIDYLSFLQESFENPLFKVSPKS